MTSATRSTALAAVLQALGTLLITLVFALVIIAGATKWLPPGAAGVNHIIIPIIAFPLVWIVCALALYGAERRGRAWAITGGVVLVHMVLIVIGFAVGGGP